MAPEQVEPAASVGPSADVWSLGLLAFAMLTGRSFWRGANPVDGSPAEVLGELLSRDKPPASARAEALGVGHLVPPGFDGWFARATARDATQRYADASAAFRELDPILANASATFTAPAALGLTQPALAVTQAPTAAPLLDLPASLTQFANPAPIASPPAVPVPPPAFAPVYAPLPVTAPPSPHPRKWKPSVIAGIALGAAAAIGLGVFGITRLTAKPEKPKRTWADDDDDDRPARKRRSPTEGERDFGAPEGAKLDYKPARLDLHVMSKCPFAVQVENTLTQVKASLGPGVDINIEFIGRERDGEFTSLHGPSEVQGDLFQVCAEKHTSKWFEVLACQNKNNKQVDTNWDSCAVEVAVPASEITAVDACAAGQEGKDLLSLSFKQSTSVGAAGSPTIFLNGDKYQGGRTLTDFTRKICAAFPAGTRHPSVCDTTKPAPEVNVQILSDLRCSDCKPEQLKTRLAAKFGNAKFTIVDYLDPAGAALWSTVRPNKLPLAIFDIVSADADPDGATIVAASKKVGTNYVLGASTDWNPECADPGGCALPSCASNLTCRPETPGTVDLYIMSQCPFAARALVALKEVMKNFSDHGATVAVNVHYIGDEKSPGVLTSMHGNGEVEDDERGMCVAKYWPKRFLDYLYCRADNVKGPWQDCAGPGTPFDAGTIAGCATGADGPALLSKSFQESKDAGIGASPTWIANGKYKFSGIDAETIKTGICAHNALPGCSVTLSGSPPRPSKSSGAAPPTATAPSCGSP
ncbi:MAG: hypothetical protein U0414_03335 [Polyangiaceae bacterium]